MRDAQSQSRLEGVQVARALAAMLVVCVHAIDLAKFRHLRHGDPLGWLSGGAIYSDFGASGVDFFFVISGFVMTMVLMQPVERQPGRFLDDRFIRIMPLYWLMSLLCLTEFNWLGRPWELENLAMSVSLWPILDPGKFSQPILFVGWTLAFEFAFYVSLLPWLRVEHSRRLTGAALMTAVLAGVGLLLAPRLDLAALFLNPIWFEFLAGILLFGLWRRGLPCQVGLAAGGVGLIALAVGFAVRVVPDVKHFAVFDEGAGAGRALFWGVPYALVLAGLLSLGGKGSRPFWRGLCKVGDASYSLYLVHPMALLLIEYRLPPGLLPPDIISLLGFTAAVSLGLVAHLWVELPMLDWFRQRRKAGERLCSAPALS